MNRPQTLEVLASSTPNTHGVLPLDHEDVRLPATKDEVRVFGIWAESPTIPKPLIKFTKSPFGVTLAEVVTIWPVGMCWNVFLGIPGQLVRTFCAS